MKVSLSKTTLGFFKPPSGILLIMQPFCTGHCKCKNAKVLLRIQQSVLCFLSVLCKHDFYRNIERVNEIHSDTISLIFKSKTETLTIQQMEKGYKIFGQNMTLHAHIFQWLCDIPLINCYFFPRLFLVFGLLQIVYWISAVINQAG